MTGVLDNEVPALELRVLGPLVVMRAGEQIRIGGLRQRAVLARLICSLGRIVTIDQLAAAVWTDSIPSGYVSTLQTYIFHLRQALEPNRRGGAAATVLRTESGGYRLDLDTSQATLTFVDSGGTDVHELVNTGATPAETIAVQFIPQGQPRRIDEPKPSNCHG